MLASGKSKTFKEACDKIKIMEQEENSKRKKNSFIAEQARDLYELFHSDERK